MLIITTFLVALFTYIAVQQQHAESNAPGRFPMKSLFWRSSVVGALVAAVAFDIAELMEGHLIGGLIDWLRYLPRSFVYLWLWYLLFRLIERHFTRPKTTTSTDVVPYLTDPTERG